MNTFYQQLAIDKAADGERVSLLKRATLTPEDALKEAIASGLADISITDKAAWIAEQTKAYNDHISKGAVAFRKKGATEMALHDEVIVAIAKNVCDRGADPVFEKFVFKQAIDGRVFDLYKVKPDAGDRVYPTAFTKCITTDPDGIALFKAMRFAKGSETVPDGALSKPSSTPWPAPRIPGWSDPGNTDDFGPANKEMNVRASDHAKANPRKSPQSAYAYTYTHPDNIALREACKEEERKYKMGKAA